MPDLARPLLARRRLAPLACAVAAALAQTPAAAEHYSLWINGRTGGGQIGQYDDFTYWGPASVEAGVNKRAVNWDGYHRIADQNPLVRQALDCYCTGDNWCYVAAHSAGNLMIGYALALYGGTAGEVTDAAPGADGRCTALPGRTQTGWNIRWVDISAGAAGGSELSDAGAWAVDEPLVSDLRTGTARAMYNHHDTRGLAFNLYAGASGTLYSFVLPGQDDEAVAYHSSGGVSGSGGGNYCNPADWFCKDLTLGDRKVEGGKAKWLQHSVIFRDDRERFDHYTRNQWGGVTSLVRQDMVARAVEPSAVAGLGREALQARLRSLHEAREAYRHATRHPPESRPLAEQPDQVLAAAPVPLRVPLLAADGTPTGVWLASRQARVYTVGAQDTVLPLRAENDAGEPLALQVLDARLQGLDADHRPGPALADAVVPEPAAAPAGGLALRLRHGLAAVDGAQRLSLVLRAGGATGQASFEWIHTAQPPARWAGAVREALGADGALHFTLPLQVQQPGRYVVNARVHDALGRPLALLGFNERLAAGAQAVSLRLAGSLVHEARPVFPLQLRELSAFLLHPQGFPDRALLPVREGLVHTTAVHPLAAFDPLGWQGEERLRHLAAHDRAIGAAEAALATAGPAR